MFCSLEESIFAKVFNGSRIPDYFASQRGSFDQVELGPRIFRAHSVLDCCLLFKPTRLGSLWSSHGCLVVCLHRTTGSLIPAVEVGAHKKEYEQRRWQNACNLRGAKIVK